MDKTPPKPFDLAGAIYEAVPVQVVLTLVIYAVYAVVMAVALVPSVLVAVSTWQALVPERASGLLAWLRSGGSGFGLVQALLLALAWAAALWMYFVWASVWYALVIRLLTLGFKPGRYPKASITMLRWLIQSGIQTVAMNSVLPWISVGFFTNLYYTIIGARVGKNVYIRATAVVDPYLLTLEDGVILGGNAELSCHFMEPNHLVLQPIHIGKNSLVGSGAYVAPGTVVGDHAVVGARVYLRPGTRVPDRAVYTVISGLPTSEVRQLERQAAGGRRWGSRPGLAAQVPRDPGGA